MHQATIMICGLSDIRLDVSHHEQRTLCIFSCLPLLMMFLVAAPLAETDFRASFFLLVVRNLRSYDSKSVRGYDDSFSGTGTFAATVATG